MTLNTAPDGHELALARWTRKPITYAARPPPR
jgi:hypothetical protein